MGFEIKGEDVSEYKERRVRPVVPGKQPRNIDFIAERDGVGYRERIRNT